MSQHFWWRTGSFNASFESTGRSKFPLHIYSFRMGFGTLNPIRSGVVWILRDANVAGKNLWHFPQKIVHSMG